MGLGEWIDVEASGEYAGMLPVEIRDLNDVVTHYDELVRYFSTWPDGNSWGELKRQLGMRSAYCAIPIGKKPASSPAGFPTDQ